MTMNIRSFCISLLSVTLLSACATVSMVPAKIMVESNFAPSQTRLVEVCDAYNRRAVSAGWVAPAQGLFDFARVLLDGAPQQAAAPDDYTSTLDFVGNDADALYLQVARDIDRARDGLQIVIGEAQMLSQTEGVPPDQLRASIISFESALITGQKSRRSFIQSLDMIDGLAGDSDAENAETSLSLFEGVLDEARETADVLEGVYVTRTEEQSELS